MNKKNINSIKHKMLQFTCLKRSRRKFTVKTSFNNAHFRNMIKKGLHFYVVLAVLSD